MNYLSFEYFIVFTFISLIGIKPETSYFSFYYSGCPEKYLREKSTLENCYRPRKLVY